MTRYLKGIGLGVAALCLTAAAASADPAMWVVRDADLTIYLFGTVHILPPDTAWLTPAIEAAFDGSGQLYVEIAEVADPMAIMPVITQYGMSDTPLHELLTPEEMAALEQAVVPLGVPVAAFDNMKPWLVALELSVIPMISGGAGPEPDPANLGVDERLAARATAAGMPIVGLETAEQQVLLIAGASDDDALAALRAALDPPGFGKAMRAVGDLNADAMVILQKAWLAGKPIDVAGDLDDMAAADPDGYATLLTDRNANWVDQIAAMMDGSGQTFIAVGAAHLWGDDSVIAMLQARGFDVERVQ